MSVTGNLKLMNTNLMNSRWEAEESEMADGTFMVHHEGSRREVALVTPMGEEKENSAIISSICAAPRLGSALYQVREFLAAAAPAFGNLDPNFHEAIQHAIAEADDALHQAEIVMKLGETSITMNVEVERN